MRVTELEENSWPAMPLTNVPRVAQHLPRRRLKVLLSAYACRPGRGSEPGVGWHVAQQIAKYHDAWVLTASINRPAIEHALGRSPVPGLRFVYYDLPPWIGWWKRGPRGVQLHYYLWQFGAYSLARDLHLRIGFDLAQHAQPIPRRKADTAGSAAVLLRSHGQIYHTGVR